MGKIVWMVAIRVSDLLRGLRECMFSISGGMIVPWRRMKRLTVVFLALLASGGKLQAQLWSKVGGSCSHFVRSMLPDSVSNSMIVVGSFQRAGDSLVRGVATWDGAVWKPIGEGTGDTLNVMGGAPIITVTRYQDDLFVGGMMFMEGDRSIKFLSRWDGTRWNACGNPTGPAYLETTNGRFFAMGGFDSIGGRPIKYLAEWDGQEWQGFGDPLQLSFGSRFVCSEFFRGEYYFAGNFTHPDGTHDIVRWNGSDWEPLGAGIAGDVWVNDITVYKGQLFVAGDFHAGVGNPSSFVIAWDGNQWYDPFPNVQYTTQVNALEVIDGKLYLTGSHAVWNGTEWKGLYNLAKYDGQEFCSFGGDNLWTLKIAGFHGDLYVATGQVINPFGADSLFPNGRDTVNFIAKWMGGDSVDICISQPVGRPEPVVTGERVSVYPNPATDGFSLDFGEGAARVASVSVLDLNGRVVIGERSYREGDPPVDVSHLPAGVYVVRVRTRVGVENDKLVVN